MLVAFTRSTVTFDGLAAACRAAGYATVWCGHDQPQIFRGAVAALWDAASLDQENLQQLERIRLTQPQLPIVALLGFPRHDQIRQLRQSGATSVVACPFVLPDLWHAIEEAIDSRVA